MATGLRLTSGLVLAAALLAACGFETDARAPRVVASEPADGAAAVREDTAIAVWFDEPLDPDSLGPAPLRVFAGDRAVAGESAYDPAENALWFTPASPLAKLETHRIELDPALADHAGNRVEPWSAAFTVRDGAWQAPVPLAEGADAPALAVATDGAALAAWVQAGGFYPAVWLAHGERAWGWGEPGSVDVYEWGAAAAPGVAAAPDGAALLYWLEDDDGTANGGTGSGVASLWAANHDPAAGWSAPVEVDGSAPLSDGVFAAAGGLLDDGRGLLVWVQDSAAAGRRRLRGALYDPQAGTWSPPQWLDDGGAVRDGAQAPALAVAGDAAVLLWVEAGGGSTRLLARRWDGTDWGPARSLYDGTAGAEPWRPAAALAAGRAWAAWFEASADAAPGGRLWIRGGEADWGPAQAVAGGLAGADLRLAAAAGAARAVVADAVAADRWVLRAFAGSAGGGAWAEDDGLPAEPAAGARWAPRLVLDPAGHAMLCWWESATAMLPGAEVALRCARRAADAAAWAAPVDLAAPAVAAARPPAPALGVDAAGDLWLSWVFDDGGVARLWVAAHEGAP